jgi:hypothetical protein
MEYERKFVKSSYPHKTLKTELPFGLHNAVCESLNQYNQPVRYDFRRILRVIFYFIETLLPRYDITRTTSGIDDNTDSKQHGTTT